MVLRMGTWIVCLGLAGGLCFSVLSAQPPGGVPGVPHPTPTPPPDLKPEKAPATIIVYVPADATIWVGEQKMTQSGPVRSFRSPPLDPGVAYYYKFKLSWPTGGPQETVKQEQITVRAGQTSTYDYRPPQPPPQIHYPRYEGSGYFR